MTDKQPEEFADKQAAGSLYLMHGEVLLGELTNPKLDMPFVFCKFSATPAFESVRALFDEELRLLNDNRMSEFLEADRRIHPSG